jgi:DNA-directed RNA polymerase specialized sigma subunit
MQDYVGLEAEILDELSDGQWHPLYKIRREVGTRVKQTRDFKSKMTKSLALLVADDILIEGNNESYRLLNPNLEKWRSIRDNLTVKNRNKSPRYFGGMLEDDGWLLSPLQHCDMVHFRMEQSYSSSEIRAMLDVSDYDDVKVIVDYATQLIRIYVQVDYPIKDVLLRLKNEKPELGMHSIRLEKNLRRRNVNDLPEPFVSDVCTYYGKFAKVLLRPYMSSITKHIKEYDDIQQQIYMWIIEAIQRYDAETSIPFAAYLASSLKKWVFNLARESYGRSVADAELKYSRVLNQFTAENGREPNQEELMEILQMSGEDINKEKLAMATVTNLRNTATINDDEAEIQLPSQYHFEDELEARVEATILSATVTRASLESRHPTLSILAIYYNVWGKEKASKKLLQFLSIDTVVRSRKEAFKIAERLMNEND